MTAPRTVAWFSCGAASAVVAKLLADEAQAGALPGPLEVVYIQPGRRGETGGEHPDNARFRRDVEAWIGRPIRVLCNDAYEDHFDAALTRGYIKGPRGALCTRELKREVRMGFERPDDVQAFGYTLDEADRADRFRLNNPAVTLRTPLIESRLDKADCLGLLFREGIEVPVMYRQGYDHNNCVGCFKGGMGYWNRVRRDYPEAFETASAVERAVGHSILKDEDGPVWLDELDPERGRMEDEPPISCGLTCMGLSLSPHAS